MLVTRMMHWWGPVDLAGTATISLTSSGNLGLATSLVGTITITLIPSGDLKPLHSLSGTATVTLTPSGNLSVSTTLSGTVTITLTPSGDLVGFQHMTGTVNLLLTPSGDLFLQSDLVGTATITLTPSGDLVGFQHLTGTGNISLTPSGNLTLATVLSGTVGISLTPSGNPTLLAGLAGTATITLSPSGNVTLLASMAATATITITPSGDLQISNSVDLSGTVTFSLTPSGNVTLLTSMSATATITVTPSGDLEVSAGLNNIIATMVAEGHFTATCMDVITSTANNPKSKSVNIIWAIGHNGSVEWTNSSTEKDVLQDQSGQIGQQYYLLTFPNNPARDNYTVVPLFRLFTNEGSPFAYSTQQRVGQRHVKDRLLGYMSTVKLPGMVVVRPPRGPIHLVEDSRYQAAYDDFQACGTCYAYPRDDQTWDGTAGDIEDSQHEEQEFFKYSSGEYDHTVEVNKLAPHIWRWRIENPGDSLDIQVVNNNGLGRGIQGAFFQNDNVDAERVETDPLIVQHNQQQSGNSVSPGGVATGDLMQGGILVSYASGSDFIDFTVIPVNNQNADTGPVTAPPADSTYPGSTFWHGQTVDRAEIYPALTYRHRIDFDWLGREGVHKTTFEFTTPKEIVGLPLSTTVQSVIQAQLPIYVLVSMSDDGYVYDPDNHTAPFLLSSYTVPTASSVGLDSFGNACVPPEPAETPLAWDDWWAFLVGSLVMLGERRGRETECDDCNAALIHTFAVPGDPPNEPRFKSSKASVFLKSRYPVAAPAAEKFGFGLAAPITPRGPLSGLKWGNFNGPCHVDNDSIDEKAVTLQTLESNILLVSPAAGQHVVWPSGTTTAIQFVITDRFDRYQGHVDWLDSQGLL